MFIDVQYRYQFVKIMTVQVMLVNVINKTFKKVEITGFPVLIKLSNKIKNIILRCHVGFKILHFIFVIRIIYNKKL